MQNGPSNMEEFPSVRPSVLLLPGFPGIPYLRGPRRPLLGTPKPFWRPSHVLGRPPSWHYTTSIPSNNSSYPFTSSFTSSPVVFTFSFFHLFFHFFHFFYLFYFFHLSLLLLPSPLPSLIFSFTSYFFYFFHMFLLSPFLSLLPSTPSFFHLFFPSPLGHLHLLTPSIRFQL